MQPVDIKFALQFRGCELVRADIKINLQSVRLDGFDFYLLIELGVTNFNTRQPVSGRGLGRGSRCKPIEAIFRSGFYLPIDDCTLWILEFKHYRMRRRKRLVFVFKNKT